MIVPEVGVEKSLISTFGKTSAMREIMLGAIYPGHTVKRNTASRQLQEREIGAGIGFEQHDTLIHNQLQSRLR